MTLQTRSVLLSEVVYSGGASSAFSSPRYFNGKVVRKQTRVFADFLNGKLKTFPSGKAFPVYNRQGRLIRAAKVADIIGE